MPRMPFVNPDTVPEAGRPLVEQIKRERGGSVIALYQMLLNSPAICAGWLHLGTAVRYEASLADGMRELIICRIALLTGARYEWHHHQPIALKSGVTQVQIDDLERWRESAAYSPAQRAALAYAEQVTQQIDADDETFAAVRAQFNDQELLELTTTIAFYNMVSRVLRPLRVEEELG